jgi:hypothetical protein
MNLARWIAVGLWTLLLGLVLRATTNPMGFGDAETYLAIAQHVGQFTVSPHGYRLLVPYAAAALSALSSLSLLSSFLIWTAIAFIGVNLTLIFWFHHLLSFPLSTALLLDLLYAISYAGVYNLHNFVHVGYWEHWVILLGVIAIYHESFPLLAGTLLVGSWIKETTVLLLPLFIFIETATRGVLSALRKALSLVLIFLAVFVLLRSGILLQGTNGVNSYSSFYTLDYVRFIIGGWSVNDIYSTFQLLWLLAALGLLWAQVRVRWMTLLIPLAISQLVLATDTLRMTAIAFPAILLLCAQLFRRMTFAEQIVVASLNPIAFYMYNSHDRYLLAFTLWTGMFLLGWFAVVEWLARGYKLPQGLLRIPRCPERVLWGGLLVGILGAALLLTLNAWQVRGSSAGFGLVLLGFGIAQSAMISRRIVSGDSPSIRAISELVM